MNSISSLLLRAGCSPYTARWVKEDFAEEYSAWLCPAEFAQFLVGVGFDPAEVSDLAWDVASVAPTVAAALSRETRGVPGNEAAEAVSYIVVLCRFVPEGALMDLMRSRFPLERVAGEVVKFYDSAAA